MKVVKISRRTFLLPFEYKVSEVLHDDEVINVAFEIVKDSRGLDNKDNEDDLLGKRDEKVVIVPENKVVKKKTKAVSKPVGDDNSGIIIEKGDAIGEIKPSKQLKLIIDNKSVNYDKVTERKESKAIELKIDEIPQVIEPRTENKDETVKNNGVVKTIKNKPIKKQSEPKVNDEHKNSADIKNVGVFNEPVTSKPKNDNKLSKNLKESNKNVTTKDKDQISNSNTLINTKPDITNGKEDDRLEFNQNAIEFDKIAIEPTKISKAKKIKIEPEEKKPTPMTQTTTNKKTEDKPVKKSKKQPEKQNESAKIIKKPTKDSDDRIFDELLAKKPEKIKSINNKKDESDNDDEDLLNQGMEGYSDDDKVDDINEESSDKDDDQDSFDREFQKKQKNLFKAI